MKKTNSTILLVGDNTKALFDLTTPPETEVLHFENLDKALKVAKEKQPEVVCIDVDQFKDFTNFCVATHECGLLEATTLIAITDSVSEREDDLKKIGFYKVLNSSHDKHANLQVVVDTLNEPCCV